MFNRDIFKQRLNEIRQSRKLTIEQLAKALDLSTGAVGHWENGYRIPSLEVAATLADFFCVSIDYLVGRNDDPQYEIYLPKAENVLLKDMPAPFIEIFKYAKSKGLKKEKITPIENWNLISWFEEWKQNTQSYIDYYAKLKDYEKSEDEKYIKKQMEGASPFKPILPRTTGFWDVFKRNLLVKKPELNWYVKKTIEDMNRDDFITRELYRLIGVNLGIDGDIHCTPIPNHLSNYLYLIIESDLKKLHEAYIKKIGD